MIPDTETETETAAADPLSHPTQSQLQSRTYLGEAEAMIVRKATLLTSEAYSSQRYCNPLAELSTSTSTSTATFTATSIDSRSVPRTPSTIKLSSLFSSKCKYSEEAIYCLSPDWEKKFAVVPCVRSSTYVGLTSNFCNSSFASSAMAMVKNSDSSEATPRLLNPAPSLWSDDYDQLGLNRGYEDFADKDMKEESSNKGDVDCGTDDDTDSSSCFEDGFQPYEGAFVIQHSQDF